jgi:hypothetical protein
MKKVNLYEVKVREVMAFDRYDMHLRSVNPERIINVDESPDVFVDMSIEKASVPVQHIVRHINGSRNEELIAIHPYFAKALIPEILDEACKVEYERARNRVKVLDIEIEKNRKDLATVKRSNDDLMSRIKAIGTLSFSQRLKFLFTGRSEYL